MNNVKQMLTWLKNRCIFRYRENNESQTISIIDNLLKIIEDSEACSIDIKVLDKIIGKYYFDFEMNKSNDTDGFEMGFTDKDRILLRHNISNIVKDIMQHISNTNLDQIDKDKQNISDIFNHETVFDSTGHTIQA